MAITSKLTSVVIPTYNRATLLPRAVRSVVAQSHRPIEVIIVDDESSDGTINVAQQLALAYRTDAFSIQVVLTKHRGVSAARNTGAAIARGTFLQFLDSDDELLPGKIAEHIVNLERTGADYSVGVSEFLDRGGRTVGTTHQLVRRMQRSSGRAYYSAPLWTVNSVLYRAFVNNGLAPFDEDLIAGEDQLQACRLKLSQFRPAVIFQVSDRVFDHGLQSATHPRDLQGLQRYGESFAVALDRMYVAIVAANRMSNAERRQLWRYSLGNVVRFSQAGACPQLLGGLGQMRRFAPWYLMPATLCFSLIANPSSNPAAIYRLWRRRDQIRRKWRGAART